MYSHGVESHANICIHLHFFELSISLRFWPTRITPLPRGPSPIAAATTAARQTQSQSALRPSVAGTSREIGGSPGATIGLGLSGLGEGAEMGAEEEAFGRREARLTPRLRRTPRPRKMSLVMTASSQSEAAVSGSFARQAGSALHPPGSTPPLGMDEVRKTPSSSPPEPEPEPDASYCASSAVLEPGIKLQLELVTTQSPPSTMKRRHQAASTPVLAPAPTPPRTLNERSRNALVKLMATIRIGALGRTSLPEREVKHLPSPCCHMSSPPSLVSSFFVFAPVPSMLSFHLTGWSTACAFGRRGASGRSGCGS